MTEPIQENEVERTAADPAAAFQGPNCPEPVDNGDEKDYIEVTTHGSPSSQNDSHSVSSSDEKRPHIDRTISYATNASVPSHTEESPKKKPWYKHINPLRWGGIPPVPEKREVSREYTASFLSMVYFQWIAKLMQVRINSQSTHFPSHILTALGWLQTAARNERYLPCEP
jgi:ATP-binding cassette subfamily C (CFTR/MRP) protein 1